MPEPDDTRNEPRGRPLENSGPEAEELNGDMTKNDLITSLQYMKFPNGTGLGAMDRPVRDFLLHALKRR